MRDEKNGKGATGVRRWGATAGSAPRGRAGRAGRGGPSDARSQIAALLAALVLLVASVLLALPPAEVLGWGVDFAGGTSYSYALADGAADTAATAAAVRSRLSALGVRGARLVAHSFGGRVALKLLASRPDLFSRALLVGCAGIPPKRGIRYRAKVAAYRAVRRAAPRFAERHFGSAEYRTLSPLMRESYKKIVNEDLTPCLSRIRVPVLYVFGEKDTATPPYMARALARGTEGSGLVFLENCSHFCFVEQPEKFNAVMLEFFR